MLASRMADRCSNLDREAVTSGPEFYSDRAANVGVATHITAVTPSGPCYESDADAAGPLCRTESGYQTCATFSDTDLSRYAVHVLQRLKAVAASPAAAMPASGVGFMRERFHAITCHFPRQQQTEPGNTRSQMVTRQAGRQLRWPVPRRMSCHIGLFPAAADARECR